MRRSLLLVLVPSLLACKKGEEETGSMGPLGIPIQADGLLWAGAATVDLTPDITETFTDLDGDSTFDGCLDEPAGGTEDCSEPFDDADGDGTFDAVFIAGFGSMRAARSVHDPIEANAVVLAWEGQYVAFVGLDVIGITSDRTHPARDALAADGFDPTRLLVSSHHNHEGPDTIGLWGNTDDLADITPGYNPDYQARITAAVEQSVRDAAAAMVPVTLKVGATRLRDQDPYFNSAAFGGKNPGERTRGLIHDIRDPVDVSDQVLALQGTGSDGATVFTLTTFSGHPETWGDRNDALSSDWPGVTRQALEATYGGVAISLPESLGGMQSALGAQVPLVDEGGNPVLSGETDGDGAPVPTWAVQDTWEMPWSVGWHVARGAMAALDGGETVAQAPIQVDVENTYVPISNVAFQLMAQMGVFDLDPDHTVTDQDLCPEAADIVLGCMEMATFRVAVGPVGFISVPGELFPEVAWPAPTDEAWTQESTDPQARGEGSTFFPQHDPDCDALTWADCQDEMEVGECDCLSVHAWPYELGATPLLDLLDTPYRSILGITDNYGGYIVPPQDFNTTVSAFSDQGDHYEETNSLSPVFATRIQEAQARISARW